MNGKNNNSTNNDSDNKNDFSAKVKSDQTKNDKKEPYYIPPNPGNKFGVFFSSLSGSNLAGLVFLMLAVAALPFVILTSRSRQDLRQRASSGGAYLTVYPNNVNPGDKIIITESGPADCSEGLKEPETAPLGGLTNCELINASTNCTDNCQITWQCTAGEASNKSYVVNVGSDKCNAESYLNIKNRD